MPTARLASMQTDYVEALLDMGEYGNKSEVQRAALRCLWDHLPPEKRVQAAVSHYRSGHASISKAAALAGVPFHEMKTILHEEGALVVGHADPEKSQAAAKRFLSK